MRPRKLITNGTERRKSFISGFSDCRDSEFFQWDYDKKGQAECQVVGGVGEGEGEPEELADEGEGGEGGEGDDGVVDQGVEGADGC